MAKSREQLAIEFADEFFRETQHLGWEESRGILRKRTQELFEEFEEFLSTEDGGFLIREDAVD